MNEELVKKIASEIANETILQNLYFYLLFLGVGFVGAYAVSYVKAYSAEKAKNKAISSDLADIKKQLAETTKVTEQIKSDIEHAVWRKKAVEAVKREKLEEYFQNIYSGKEALHDHMISAFFHKEESHDRHALNKADILQKLYFPELSEAHQGFQMATANYLRWISLGQNHIATQMQQGIPKPSPTQEHMDLQSDILEAINNAATILSEAGKTYADSLNA